MATTLSPKPLLRGHFHQAAFFIALGACAMLIANSTASGTTAIFSTIIYSVALIILFGVSALYHRPQWSNKNRARMRRFDHAAIFLVIGGTCVPICLLGLQGELGRKVLVLVLSACLFGVLKEFFWINSPKWLTTLLYLGVSWLIAPFSTQMFAALGAENFYLLLAGGILYTIGAVVYALKRPIFYPKVFGYHELFHILVILASICHFILVCNLIKL